MYVKDIDTLLRNVKSWKGPKGGKGWWCPMQQTYEPAGGNCLHTLVGHADAVSCSAFNYDGTKIVSGSWDKTIRVWNVATGECIVTLEGHTDNVNSVAFNHDGTKIVSGSDDKTIRVWNAVSYTHLTLPTITEV